MEFSFLLRRRSSSFTAAPRCISAIDRRRLSARTAERRLLPRTTATTAEQPDQRCLAQHTCLSATAEKDPPPTVGVTRQSLVSHRLVDDGRAFGGVPPRSREERHAPFKGHPSRFGRRQPWFPSIDYQYDLLIMMCGLS